MQTSHPKLRIAFGAYADRKMVRSQCLTARDIALSLDPAKFDATFFYVEDPDPRLLANERLRLVRVPKRYGTVRIAQELLTADIDFLFYFQSTIMPPNLVRGIRLLKKMGSKKRTICTVEVSAAQLRETPESVQRQYLEDLREADYSIAITHYVRDSFRDEFGLTLDSKVIPLGVDLDRFRYADRAHHRATLKVLFVGHLDRRKRPNLIVDLAARMQGQKIEFHLIGEAIRDQEYAAGLRAQSPGNVIFHGSLDPESVASWMRRSDVFLLPSLLEGLPRVTLEASATGLPCIVFDEYETPSVVNGVTGFQVVSIEEMEVRLQSLIDHRDSRLSMGHAASAHAEKFRWPVVAHLWEERLLSDH